MDQTYRNVMCNQAYIDGQWVGTPATDVTDKATGETIAKVPDLGKDETRRAIEAAKSAMPEWSRRTAKERSGILRRWFDLIIEHQDELAELLSREQGKPLAEAKGEITYGAGFVEFFAEQAKRIYGETIPSPKPDGRILVLKQPIGVVAAITPWNFPNAMITRKVTPALAAGCTAVVKPAEATPLSALALAKLGAEAGIPAGVLNIVTGSDPKPIGKEMCEHPDVRMITFTGSTAVGKTLLRQAAGTVKKTSMELGGNAPLIVFDDADLERAVAAAMACKFRNAGQTCVCANRMFVQAGIYDAFVERLVKETEALKVGSGLEDGVEIGPLINEAAVEKVEAHIADAQGHGAKVETGGARHERGGTFFTPTVLSGVTSTMRVACEETFGPVAALIRFDSENEVIHLANDTRFGLASYFFARDVNRVWRVAEALEYGIVGINEGVVSSELAPFGGVKESGLGREGSHHGIEEFVEMKYVYLGGLTDD
jgi:succinate-semialdehyde dehydrogenase / glutarate-semialdehyde dehydrogenase